MTRKVEINVNRMEKYPGKHMNSSGSTKEAFVQE